MKTEVIQIEKPLFNGDVYRILNNEDSKDFDSLITIYDSDNNPIKSGFIDIKNKVIAVYDNNESVTYGYFSSDKELLSYLKVTLVKYQGKDNIYEYDLIRAIKKLKIYMDSRKKNKLKELRKGETVLKIGTILNTCWGYDQTNIEMFRVIKIIGKNYFLLDEIMLQTIKGSEGFMCQSVTAGNNSLGKLPIKAFISNDGYMSISEQGYKRSLSIHKEGDKHYNSWYA